MRYKIKNCDFFLRSEFNSTYRALTCLDEDFGIKTFKITNTSIVLFSSHGVSRNTPRWIIGKLLDGV